jgi:AhpD family alkylhydroperoxidase
MPTPETTRTTHAVQPRMKNPALVVPDAMAALAALETATTAAGVPARTLHLVHLRASQINGCSFCVDLHSRDAKKDGDTDERIFGVGAWRESPYFTDAERAAFALTETLTRLSDSADAVPDELWAEATQHYDEPALGALILSIALVNLWNRLNAATHQVPGSWA